jgi:hypothetical protein
VQFLSVLTPAMLVFTCNSCGKQPCLLKTHENEGPHQAHGHSRHKSGVRPFAAGTLPHIAVAAQVLVLKSTRKSPYPNYRVEATAPTAYDEILLWRERIPFQWRSEVLPASAMRTLRVRV